MLNTHLHLEARLRMNGAIPPLFMMWIGTNLSVITFKLRIPQSKGYGLENWGIISYIIIIITGIRYFYSLITIKSSYGTCPQSSKGYQELFPLEQSD
jgi:hypothetical protein